MANAKVDAAIYGCSELDGLTYCGGNELVVGSGWFGAELHKRARRRERNRIDDVYGGRAAITAQDVLESLCGGGGVFGGGVFGGGVFGGGVVDPLADASVRMADSLKRVEDLIHMGNVPCGQIIYMGAKNSSDYRNAAKLTDVDELYALAEDASIHASTAGVDVQPPAPPKGLHLPRVSARVDDHEAIGRVEGASEQYADKLETYRTEVANHLVNVAGVLKQGVN